MQVKFTSRSGAKVQFTEELEELLDEETGTRLEAKTVDFLDDFLYFGHTVDLTKPKGTDRVRPSDGWLLRTNGVGQWTLELQD